MRPDRPKDFPVGPDASVSGGLPSRFQPTGKPNARRPVSPHLTVTVAIVQAGSITCPLCKKPLTADHKRVLEHLVPVALGGGNTVDNLRWVHAGCAAEKTNGNAATCADGDIHKIAKSKRLERAREAHRAVLAGETTREPGKIKHRGFSRVFRKKINGSVVPR